MKKGDLIEIHNIDSFRIVHGLFISSRKGPTMGLPMRSTKTITALADGQVEEYSTHRHHINKVGELSMFDVIDNLKATVKEWTNRLL